MSPGIYHYNLGGLAIRSSLALPGLRRFSDAEQPGAPEIQIVFEGGEPPRGDSLVFPWPGRYGMRLWSCAGDWLFTSAQDGSYWVAQDGSRVRCHAGATKGASGDDGMLQLLVRRILPRVAQLRGRIGLHGATVHDGRRAWLLLGASGAGKSTLSVALHRYQGWEVLSDDISLVDAGADAAYCYPVVSGACLWPDSLSSLDAPGARVSPLPGHEEKRWREFGQDSPIQSATISGVVFLDAQDRGDATGLRRLSPPQALGLAVAQLVRFNPVDRQAFATHSQRLGNLMRHLPAYTFSYPRNYPALPEVTAQLRGGLALHAAA